MVVALTLAMPVGALAQVGSEAPTQRGENQPSPQQVVERCLESMRATTERAVEGIRGSTGHALGLIARLADNGAPDGLILRAGRAGSERIGQIGSAAARRINADAERCLRLLRALGAPPEAALVVLEARQRSLGAVREAGGRGRELIFAAVQEAVGAPAE